MRLKEKFVTLNWAIYEPFLGVFVWLNLGIKEDKTSFPADLRQSVYCPRRFSTLRSPARSGFCGPFDLAHCINVNKFSSLERKQQSFPCFFSASRRLTLVLRQSWVERQLGICRWSFLFSSWLWLVLQPCVGSRMWQEPLGWGMTAKCAPTFRARTEESPNNRPLSDTPPSHEHSLFVQSARIQRRVRRSPRRHPFPASSHDIGTFIQTLSNQHESLSVICVGSCLQSPCDRRRSASCGQKESSTLG